MTPKTILIVDDDRNVRQSMALVLRRGNYQVDTAGTAEEALAVLQSNPYDLTILDSLMPDNDSIFLPRLLKLYPHLCILVLTSQTSIETSAETAHAGPHFRMSKPVIPEALLSQVKSILKAGAAFPGDKPEKMFL